MKYISEKELKKLLKSHEDNPKDLDVINLIALGYMENYKLTKNKEDYLFFEKAYKTKKTVKTTHNFARYLFYESGNKKKAYRIQKKCIELYPKSINPYLLFGEILIERNEYLEAINIYNKSLEIQKSREAIHNLGYCNFMLGDYELAKKYFLEGIDYDDIEYKSLYGLILTEYRLNNKEEVYRLLNNILEKNIITDMFHDYHIGSIYFLYDDYKNTTNVLLKCGIDGIDLLDWEELGYSLYITNKELFMSEILKRIIKFKGYIKELKNNYESFNDRSEKEKRRLHRYYLSEIRKSKNADNQFKNKPIVDIDKSLVAEYSNCTLFGCMRHEYYINDDDEYKEELQYKKLSKQINNSKKLDNLLANVKF